MNQATRIKSYVCPCCGGDIGEAPSIERVREMITQPSRRVIFDLLAEVPGKAVHRDVIYRRLYGHRHDGGPISGETSIHVFMSILRRQLAPYGWYISSSRGGRGRASEYRLIPIGNDA